VIELPPGPSAPDLAQTLAFHRDPLGALRRARARFGPAFTLRLSVAGPTVVVADPAVVAAFMEGDPQAAHAGEARRRVLPMASPRSTFGADGEQHREARARIAGAFAPATVAARRPQMAQLADEHAGRWPRGRPFRLLPRVRTLLDDVFMRLVLGAGDELAPALVVAMRRMLLSPGNPPVPLPGPGNDTLERAVSAFFKWRSAPVEKLLARAIDERRRRGGGGDDVIGALTANGEGLSTDAMVDELLAVLMAAQEPPSVAVTWLLDRHGREPGRDPADDAFVRETLRLQPPALGVLRRLTAPLRLDGVTVPIGASAMLPIPLLHREPAAFPEPDAFRPERWTDGAADDRLFIPFGGGARRCIGEALAQSYFAAVVPAVTQRVRMRPVSRTPERMVVRATTLVPHRSALVVAER
jgi:cytochrome P450 family 135